MALLVTALLLVLMGALVLASLDVVTREQQVAGFHKRSVTAFYAAEAGAAEARRLVRSVGARSATPALAGASLGDSTVYEHGQPSYSGDPDAANPIRWIKDGTIYAQGGNLRMGGQKFVKTLWQINVVGRAPGGSRARIEVVESKILSKGY